MTYNAGNRKDIRRLEKQARQEELGRQDVIKTIMSTPPGRQWFYDKLSGAHIFETSLSLDAIQMAFKEGERNFGLQMLNDIMQSCPDYYLEMMKEANVRHITADTRARNDRGNSEDGDGDAEGSESAAGSDGGSETGGADEGAFAS